MNREKQDRLAQAIIQLFNEEIDPETETFCDIVGVIETVKLHTACAQYRNTLAPKSTPIKVQ